MSNHTITLKFLSKFNYKFITLFILPSEHTKKPLIYPPYFAPKYTNDNGEEVKAKISHSFKFQELQNPQLLNYLENLQKDPEQKRTINFTIHETDGTPNDNPLNPNYGEKNKFTTFKACVIDTDKTPIEKFTSYLKSINLQPHITVESSKDRYHLYFLLKDTPITTESTIQYQAIQKALHQMSDPDAPPSDASMLDIPQQMKLPGFIHIKKNTLIKPVKYNEIPHYTLETIFQKTNAHIFLPKASILSSPQQYETITDSLGNTLQVPIPQTQIQQEPYTTPQEPVGTGNRHVELQKYIGKAFQMIPVKNPKSQHENSERYALIYQFISNSITNPRIFLPEKYSLHAPKTDTSQFPEDKSYKDGERHHEIVRMYEYVLNKEIKAKKDELIATLDIPKLDELPPKKEIDSSLVATPLEKSHQAAPILPPDFYASAPGLAGILIRELISISPIKNLEPFFFAETAAFLGLIKSKAVTSRGFCPVEYFGCFGFSGSGKSIAQTIYSNALTSLSLQKSVIQTLKSEAGLRELLKDTNGVALIQLDESQNLFASLSDTKAPHYIRELKPTILKLYTSSNRESYDCGRLGDRKKEQVFLHKPHLNLVMYAVPEDFSKMFTPETIQDGLFNRFIFLKDYGKYEIDIHKPFPIKFSPDILKLIREEMLFYKLRYEEKLRLDQLEKDLAFSINDEEKATLLKEIEELQNASLNRPAIEIPYTPEALALFNAYREKCIKWVNTYMDSGKKSFYTRLPEHVGRLALILSKDVINEEIINFCLTLVENVRLQFEAYFHEATTKISESSKIDPDTLYDWIKQEALKRKTPFVTYRDITRKFRKVSTFDMSRQLETLVHQEKVADIKDPSKELLDSLGYKSGTGNAIKRVIVLLKDAENIPS